MSQQGISHRRSQICAYMRNKSAVEGIEHALEGSWKPKWVKTWIQPKRGTYKHEEGVHTISTTKGETYQDGTERPSACEPSHQPMSRRSEKGQKNLCISWYSQQLQKGRWLMEKYRNIAKSFVDVLFVRSRDCAFNRHPPLLSIAMHTMCSSAHLNLHIHCTGGCLP